MGKLPELDFKVMLNVGNPSATFEFGHTSSEGIGLARLDSVINHAIGIHPKALLNYNTINAEKKVATDQKI